MFGGATPAVAKQDSSTTGQGRERLETKLRAKNQAGNQVKRTNGEASVELGGIGKMHIEISSLLPN